MKSPLTIKTLSVCSVFACLWSLSALAFERDVRVTCTNIAPKVVRVDREGALEMDVFSFKQHVRSDGVLAQGARIDNLRGQTQDNLAVTSVFLPFDQCGPIKIVANNDFNETGKATVQIEITIKNSCRASETSTYNLIRGKARILKSYTSCKVE